VALDPAAMNARRFPPPLPVKDIDAAFVQTRQ